MDIHAITIDAPHYQKIPALSDPSSAAYWRKRQDAFRQISVLKSVIQSALERMVRDEKTGREYIYFFSADAADWRFMAETIKADPVAVSILRGWGREHILDVPAPYSQLPEQEARKRYVM